ncbi:hypothetical protein BGX38DRAFT_1332634 [Terfezia claveryi]|nr:hypothetical protein BGX38DRAFT_1332634 [Terfezia claveryi]
MWHKGPIRGCTPKHALTLMSLDASSIQGIILLYFLVRKVRSARMGCVRWSTQFIHRSLTPAPPPSTTDDYIGLSITRWTCQILPHFIQPTLLWVRPQSPPVGS